MKVAARIQEGLWRWLDIVAVGLVALMARFRRDRVVSLVEGNHGHFTAHAADVAATADSEDIEINLQNGSFAAPVASRTEAFLRGSRIELLVQPDRFIFKPLELPSRAAEFLHGVVRAQIDRLTPWSADQAAYGSSLPTDAGPGRIVVTVAATAKALLAPILNAFTEMGARSVVVRTTIPQAAADMPPITVIEENVARIFDVRLVRRVLLITLGSALLVCLATEIAGIIIGDNLQARQDELAGQIARERSALLTARNSAGDPRTLAERALLRRKNETPSDVIALEILSQILPDDTYVTEMHVEANKLRLTGTTHDAPQLIRLFEQTRHFSQASFFAPITRSPSETGDRFNIEAQMEPNFSLTP